MSKPTIACVSYLNSKPLIDPLVDRPDVTVHFAVPSQLLALVDAGVASTALLPIVDYHRSQHELLLVPAGMIGCDGPTLTVRLFSTVPLDKVAAIHGDTDSHTSVVLTQVIMRERYRIAPPLVPLAAHAGEHRYAQDTLLLIGDKVVNAAPDPEVYHHQLDLGQAWKELTGLPFVFAMWMMRADMQDVAVARLLRDAQREGARRTEALLDRYAAEKQWPRDLARRYFTEYLRYAPDDRAREGIARFYALAAKHDLLQTSRPVRYLELAAP